MSPGMFVEISTDHLAELTPLRKRDGRAVHSDEALSVVTYKRQEVGFLLSIQFEFSAGEKQHRIEVVEIWRIVFELLLRQGFGIGADGRFPQTRFLAQSLDRRHGV